MSVAKWVAAVGIMVFEWIVVFLSVIALVGTAGLLRETASAE